MGGERGGGGRDERRVIYIFAQHLIGSVGSRVSQVGGERGGGGREGGMRGEESDIYICSTPNCREG